MTGIVTSNKMNKALIITIFSTKKHPIYHKTYKSKKKYAVSCTDSSKFKIGTNVQIESCKPISKTIKFRVVES
jgi:small subunit ribosomal protein S17